MEIYRGIYTYHIHTLPGCTNRQNASNEDANSSANFHLTAHIGITTLPCGGVGGSIRCRFCFA